MIIVETSNTGGEWAAKLRMSDLEFEWVTYNGVDCLKRLRRSKGSWMETAVFNLFDARYDIEEMQSDYFNTVRHEFGGAFMRF
jgi:hypothetical protein